VSTPPITLKPKLPPIFRSISTIFESDIAETSSIDQAIVVNRPRKARAIFSQENHSISPSKIRCSSTIPQICVCLYGNGFGASSGISAPPLQVRHSSDKLRRTRFFLVSSMRNWSDHI
jgi:hypothetical protein